MIDFLSCILFGLVLVSTGSLMILYNHSHFIEARKYRINLLFLGNRTYAKYLILITSIKFFAFFHLIVGVMIAIPIQLGAGVLVIAAVTFLGAIVAPVIYGLHLQKVTAYGKEFAKRPKDDARIQFQMMPS